jgi:hypothetical protein
MLSSVVTVCRLKRGDQLKVRIKGGCKSYNVPRQAGQSGDTSHTDLAGANSSLRDPYGDRSLTYVGLSLGELPFGKYDIVFSTDDQIDGAAVLNSAGDEYARWPLTVLYCSKDIADSSSIQSARGKNTLSFNVDNDSETALAFIAFTSTQVNIQSDTTVDGTTNKSSSSRPESSVRYASSTGIVVSKVLAFI